MRRVSFILSLSFALLLFGCVKDPEPEISKVPEFGKMSAIAELHSAKLKCELSSVNGITSCGVYLSGPDEESKWSGELVGNAISSEVTDLFRNTTYEYKFFISNGSEERISAIDSFATLYDGPLQKSDYIDEWGINHGKGIILGDYVWAPVNCGYHETLFKFGKFYQWGRKYGVGGAGFDVDTVATAEQWDGANGEEDASTLYFAKSGGTFENDWIKNGDALFWNSGTEDDPVKTAFDPCPQGWRVPTGKEIDYLLSKYLIPSYEEGGNWYWFRNENEYLCIPAGGGYDGKNMGYNDRGLKAFYWSSKQRHSLYFHYTYIKVQECNMVDPQNIRCIQE